MAGDYVNRSEFEVLKKEVNDIKISMKDNGHLLQKIDKQIDVILEKIDNADKVEKLKLTPLEKRINVIEDSQKWIWRTIMGTIIAIVIKIIFDVSKIIS